MNLVKAADDIKNLSDQQLLSAGQNPVMVPPYLVLAEMKRREQLRAQYAKSQQQQQQPSVAQQVAQNLAQPQMGQPQQGAPQQPPPQGIMQAAPPQAMAMAQGGHVARYADGGKGGSGISSFQSAIDAMKALLPKRAATAPRTMPTVPTTEEEYLKMYPKKSPLDFISEAESLFGKPDYSKEEQLVARQRQLAEAKRPRIGDALIAAGAAMAANRDPRVGLASLMAQGIGVGSQAYQSAKEQREKDMNTAMLAEIALNKMKQEDIGKRAKSAFDLYQADRGERIVLQQHLEAAKAREIEQYNRTIDEDRRQQHATNLAIIQASINQLNADRQASLEQKRIDATLARQSVGPRQTPAQVAKSKAEGLAFDALVQATDYLQRNPDAKKKFESANDLAIENLFNQKFFAGYGPEIRQQARYFLLADKNNLLKQERAQQAIDKANASGITGLNIPMSKDEKLNEDIRKLVSSMGGSASGQD